MKVDGPFIGRPLPRREDFRLVRGAGRYTDDFALPGQLHAVFVRSPYPAARITGVAIEEAMAVEGVRAVLTGADYLADHGGPIAHFANPADAIDHTKRAFAASGHGRAEDSPHLPMPIDHVRYLGEPVAVVIGETSWAAQDGADLVEVDYDPLTPVTDPLAALAEDASPVDPARADNVVVRETFGDRERVEQAIAGAALVIEQEFRNQRIANAQMEPRSAIAEYDEERGLYRMIAGSQGAVRQRDTLAATLGVPKDRVEVICPDVGGGFGPRTNLGSEQPVIAWAARRLGQPVRWTSTRSEAFLTDFQGRDMVTRARMGLSADGRIVGYHVEMIGNVGAYTVSFVPMANGYRVMSTAYDVPAGCASITGVLTNTIPTAPFRGAGRPESTFVIERMLDIAARRLGLDRVAIRQRNLIRREQLPYTNAMGLTYDSGDYAGNMALALEKADWRGFENRRAAAKARGRLAGIGLANYVESPVGIPHERVDVTVAAAGVVRVVAGTQSTGQGHETSFAQVMADQLGVTPNQIELITGDTRIVQSGGGSHSDRSMRLGGALLVETARQIVTRAKAVIAATLGIDAASVAFEDGLFRPEGSNRSYTVFDAAALAENASDLPDELRGELVATMSFTGRMPAYPTGAAVCEVEIDPDTGVVEITRYTSVDDAGQPINPLILDGQVHGGIVQGVGQELGEHVALDLETGQVLAGTFMDYVMPRADMVPSFSVAMVEDPTQGNPLRVKGGGESGITPSLATTINAIVDALSPLGIEHIEMPATPLRIWEAIRRAKETG